MFVANNTKKIETCCVRRDDTCRSCSRISTLWKCGLSTTTTTTTDAAGQNNNEKKKEKKRS